MYSAEAWVPGTRELLAMEVHPATHYDGLAQFLKRALSWQGEVLLDVFDPDPF
jgi:hypothetical protein